MRKTRTLLVGVVLAAALAAGGYYYWQWRSAPSPAAAAGATKGGARGLGGPTPVVAVPAASSDVDVIVNGLGTVTPLRTVTVKSRVDGELVRVVFEEGQLVKEGQLLAEIDPRPFQVQLAQAQGQLARDRALLENAHLDLERYKTLFAQDSIAKQQVDTQASLVRQYEGAVAVDASQVDNARLQLGDPIAVEAWDRDQKAKLAQGALASADNQVDPQTGTVKLKAQFPNQDGGLFPQQFVNVRMQLDTLHDAIVVPSAAVQRGAQGMFVYVVQPDKTVALRTVKLGPLDGQRQAIAEGLAPGELVVIDGVDRLRPGAPVEVAAARPEFKPPAGGAPKSAGKGRRREGSG